MVALPSGLCSGVRTTQHIIYCKNSAEHWVQLWSRSIALARQWNEGVAFAQLFRDVATKFSCNPDPQRRASCFEQGQRPNSLQWTQACAKQATCGVFWKAVAEAISPPSCSVQPSHARLRRCVYGASMPCHHSPVSTGLKTCTACALFCDQAFRLADQRAEIGGAVYASPFSCILLSIRREDACIPTDLGVRPNGLPSQNQVNFSDVFLSMKSSGYIWLSCAIAALLMKASRGRQIWLGYDQTGFCRSVRLYQTGNGLTSTEHSPEGLSANGVFGFVC